MATFIELIDAVRTNPFTIETSWSAAITDTDFAAADFETLIDLFVPVAITQNGPAGLTLAFADNLSTQTDLRFTGAIPNIETPQTVAIT